MMLIRIKNLFRNELLPVPKWEDVYIKEATLMLSYLSPMLNPVTGFQDTESSFNSIPLKTKDKVIYTLNTDFITKNIESIRKRFRRSRRLRKGRRQLAQRLSKKLSDTTQTEVPEKDKLTPCSLIQMP